MSIPRRRVLLVKPDYNFYSIGIAYVVAGLRKRGIDYDVFDAFLDPNYRLQDAISRNDYLAIATGGLIGSFTFFRRFFDAAKAAAPNLPCILGGNITQSLPAAELFRYFPIDYIVHGEGEHTLPDLIEALERGERHPASTRGIVFRDPDRPAEVVRTRPRQRIDLCAENWIPHWDAETMKRYGVEAFPILTGRGCTGHCTFCSPTNGRFRPRSLTNIMEEIEYLNATFEFGAFNFLNEILFEDIADIERFCDEYEKCRPRKPWNCLLRTDLDPRVIGRMKEVGLRAVNIGLESGSDRVLQRIRKHTTVAQTSRFVEALQRHGVIVDASFMMAHLDERPEDLVATVDLVTRLGVRGPMALTINYPGTYNYKVAKERGLVPDPERYIESLDRVYSVDHYDIISRHRAGRLHYLNLSAMSDDVLFVGVEREMRRYLSINFALRSVRTELSAGNEFWLTRAECPRCGTPVELRFDRERFALSELRAPNCTGCGSAENHVDPRAFPDFRDHLDAVRGRLELAQRVALVGAYQDVRWVLRHDHFCLDPARIVGIVAHSGCPEPYEANHPVRDLESLLADGVDLFVVPGAIPAELTAEGFVERVSSDRIVFLTPSAAARFAADRAQPPAECPPESVPPPAPAVEPDAFAVRVNHLVADWVARDARVLIHGAGSTTDRLFESTRIRDAQLVGMSSGRTAHHGEDRHGFRVRAPWEILQAKPDVVLVTTPVFLAERAQFDALAGRGVECVNLRDGRATAGSSELVVDALGIPYTLQDSVVAAHIPAIVAAIHGVVVTRRPARVAIYGMGAAGQAVYRHLLAEPEILVCGLGDLSLRTTLDNLPVLGSRDIRDVDLVLLTTNPAHQDSVLELVWSNLQAARIILVFA